MWWLLSAAVLEVGCRKADPERKPPAEATDGWAHPEPEIAVDAIVAGTTAEIGVRPVPEGATVELWVAEAMTKTCERDAFDCVELVDPVSIPHAPDASGTGVRAQFAVGPELGPRIFRAQVIDASGVAVWTEPEQRDVMRPPSETSLAFTDVRRESGVAVILAGNSHTGGVAWVDVNGDYWPDLFVTNGQGRAHELFRNNGDGTFTSWSEEVIKPDPDIEDAGVWFADIDNDGDSDILVVADSGAPLIPFVTQERPGGPNLLYRNEGDGTFTEVGEAYGVRDPDGDRNMTAGFADWDRDGFVDLYLGQLTMDNEPLGTHDDFDRLLRNRGDGTFEDVTSATGVDGMGLDALAAVWFDPNQDGWPDLYVGNASHESDPPLRIHDDAIYLNREGAFEEMARDARSWQGSDLAAPMGFDVGDVDNDGDWDLYVTDWWSSGPVPYGNALYLGQPDGGLSGNQCEALAVCTGFTGWPVSFADLDLDGWIDLYVGVNRLEFPDLVFHNQGGTLVNQGVAGMGGHASRGGGQADFDGDGDVDLAIWVLDQELRLLRNDSERQGHWLELRLLGTTSNRDAIGAVAKVVTDEHTLMRRVSGGDSAHSQSALTLHFGTGDDEVVDVEVSWPSGAITKLEDVAVDQFVVVDESVGWLPEALDHGRAVYRSAAGELEIEVQTTYRGRTSPVVDGAPMRWEPDQGAGRWTLEVDAAVAPATVQVSTPRAAFELPVSIEP